MKISALTAATTPLSGAELFPIVQSGNTRRVSLNDLLRSIGNGTAAAPALAPGGDPNTGIYFPAADTIALVTGGNERLRVDANGNFSVDSPTFFVDNVNNRVGIGTTSPSSGFTLHVVGGTRVVAAGGSRAGQFEGPSATVGSGDAQLQIASTDAAAADAGAILRFTANTTPAANFPVATIAGRHQTLAAGNYSGYLQFNVASAAGGVSERMRLDASGNLGLGVAPSAWGSSYRSVDLSTAGNLWARSSDVGIAFNAYNDGGDWRYKTAALASLARQTAGRHEWYTAASGTAGAAMTLAEVMRLDTSGNLVVGVTAVAGGVVGRFTVDGAIALVGSPGGAGAGNRYISGAGTSNTWYHNVPSGGQYSFNIAESQIWRMTSAGHFIAGADNTYDIGSPGATRPRDLHLSRNLHGAGWLRAGAASAGAASTTTIGGTTATTVGAAGAASALPTNPLGYIVAHVGTTEVRIPYYNA